MSFNFQGFELPLSIRTISNSQFCDLVDAIGKVVMDGITPSQEIYMLCEMSKELKKTLEKLAEKQ